MSHPRPVMWIPPVRFSYLDRDKLDTFIQVVFKNEISRLHTESLVEVLRLEERKESCET